MESHVCDPCVYVASKAVYTESQVPFVRLFLTEFPFVPGANTAARFCSLTVASANDWLWLVAIPGQSCSRGYSVVGALFLFPRSEVRAGASVFVHVLSWESHAPSTCILTLCGACGWAASGPGQCASVVSGEEVLL